MNSGMIVLDKPATFPTRPRPDRIESIAARGLGYAMSKLAERKGRMDRFLALGANGVPRSILDQQRLLILEAEEAVNLAHSCAG